MEGRVAVARLQAERRPSCRGRPEGGTPRSRCRARHRSLAVGPQGEWPEEAKLSLDVGRAMSAGQELSPLVAKLAYSPAKMAIEQLKIGRLENVALTGQAPSIGSTAPGGLR